MSANTLKVAAHAALFVAAFVVFYPGLQINPMWGKKTQMGRLTGLKVIHRTAR